MIALEAGEVGSDTWKSGVGDRAGSGEWADASELEDSSLMGREPEFGPSSSCMEEFVVAEGSSSVTRRGGVPVRPLSPSVGWGAALARPLGQVPGGA